MNNNNNIAATIGIGTIGSILAYYGYNRLSVKTDYVETTEAHVMDGTGIGLVGDLKNKIGTVAIEKAAIEKTAIEKTAIEKTAIENEVIKEINRTSTPENKIDGKTWENYWKNEYKNANET
tara:strand:- start:351 stop:713 length:363 start_codon:yes stop_codon:yes gene_type:complete